MLWGKQPLLGQFFLQLLKGKAQGPHPLRLHVLRVELVLAGGLVYGYPSPNEHFHTILGVKLQPSGR